ncbi:hypothetical protein [Nocardia cerradoensis]|uniref:DUF8175 domain-containing protein n=1 Tax=Nocardia cerradoensis TaxID=85688 RepID=A0A231H3T8_9NOCA|nr:hypothetical protein [Nocardia cerradoensis]NKY42340.1 hypothetical protein [Nocardia cerradoensis]OXR43501.1 hypothetical protein B7C42_04368 [Nocardia cerradoensis]
MSNKDTYDERSGISFGVIVSAAVIALIVIVGVFVYLGRDTSSSDARKTDPPPSPVAGSGATGFAEPDTDLFRRRVDIPNNPAGQPLPQNPAQRHDSSDPDWLTAAPAGTTEPRGWQRVYGASVPFSTSDGPTRIDDKGLAVGYSHTPQGAALAAAQITYRLNARPGDRDLYVRQVRVSAQQVAAYDKARGDGKLPDQQPARITKYLVAPDAFQIENYADDMAIVRLAARGPVNDGKQVWAAIRLVMVWDNGDWRLKPTDSRATPSEYVDTLQGWTRW